MKPPVFKFSGCYQADNGVIVATFNPPGMSKDLTRHDIDHIIYTYGWLGIMADDIDMEKFRKVYGSDVEPMTQVTT